MIPCSGKIDHFTYCTSSLKTALLNIDQFLADGTSSSYWHGCRPSACCQSQMYCG